MAYNPFAKYGLTVAGYDSILVAQGGVCAICHTAPSKRRLVVDHDHLSGKVRGLLCSFCNTAIGMFKDSCAALDSAKAYLAKNGADLSRTLPLAPSPMAESVLTAEFLRTIAASPVRVASCSFGNGSTTWTFDGPASSLTAKASADPGRPGQSQAEQEEAWDLVGVSVVPGLLEDGPN